MNTRENQHRLKHTTYMQTAVFTHHEYENMLANTHKDCHLCINRRFVKTPLPLKIADTYIDIKTIKTGTKQMI